MTSNAVVKHFNVFKSSLLKGGEAVVMQAFCFERTKETLHRCIIIAYAINQTLPAIASIALDCIIKNRYAVRLHRMRP